MQFEAIGTHWEIEVYDTLAASQLTNLRRAVEKRIETFDKTYSRFRDDSTLMQLAQKAGRYRLPDDAQSLFALYRSLYDITGGRVTPLIGDTLVDAGYDASYSLQPQEHIRAAARWEDTLDYTYPFISTTKPVVIDVGAAGKGHLVDIVGELLRHQDINNFLIDAGGDMLRHTTSAEPIRIGLEHPRNPGQAIGVVYLGSESICGSSSNRRAWGDMHHIIDPESTQPVQQVIATWTTAKSALLADGLATALFFTPAEELHQHFTFEHLMIYADLTYHSSPGLQADIFA
jgi:thiamine biosynthesis lipoprotein